MKTLLFILVALLGIFVQAQSLPNSNEQSSSNQTMTISDINVFQNQVCVNLLGDHSLEWSMMNDTGYVVKHFQPYAIAENCYTFYGCGNGFFSDAKVVISDFNGNRETYHFKVKSVPGLVVKADDEIIFPCGNSNFAVFNSCGQLVTSGYGFSFNTMKIVQPGLYYLKLEKLTISFVR